MDDRPRKLYNPADQRAANLKPGKSGDLKNGWSCTGFYSKDSRQKFSFCLFFRAIGVCPNCYRTPSGNMRFCQRNTRNITKEISGRKVVALSSRFPIFECFECFIGINFLPSGMPDLPGCHPVSKPPGSSGFHAAARTGAPAWGGTSVFAGTR